ncbi:MAG: hypothetical protein GY943_01200 [Chloroflexi bacterium]|nr:hypothetical protein [Chloroflexota bacterium]
MKSEFRRTYLLLFVIAVVVTACGEPLPEAVPVADATAVLTVDVEDLGTPTSLIELVEPSPEPTAVPPDPVVTVAAEPTAVPPTLEPVEDESVPLVLTITDPSPALNVNTGSSVLVAGYVDPTTAVSVTIRLQAGPHLLIDTFGDVNAETGNWIAEMMIPHSVDGMGRLTVATASETVSQELQLVYDPAADGAGVSVEMLRPSDAQFAVAGHPLFFEGTVIGALDNRITIGLLTDDCTIYAARQTFTLGAADASWNGYVNLPQEINGRTCAFVATGNADTGFWREVQMWLPSIHPDEEFIIGSITFGNPLSQPFKAGTSVYLFGSAVDATSSELEIAWLAEDGETELVTGTAVVDSLGFWETELALPAEAAGETLIVMRMGEGEDLVVMETAVTVEP